MVERGASGGQAADDPGMTQMRGGDQSEGNLVTCCKACNTLKGNQPAWSYLKRNGAARTNFLEAASNYESGHAPPVWPRLIRAIEEAARK